MITSFFIAVSSAGGGGGGGGILFPYTLVSTDGFMVKFSSASKFQDLALTTAITADGQGVGGVVDEGPNTVNLTQNVAAEKPLWVAANNSLSFDGTDDLLKVIGFKPNDTAFTYAVKFRADAGVAGIQVMLGSTNATERAWLSLSNGVLSTGVGDDDSSTTQEPSLTDLRSGFEWHVGAVSWTATNIYLYLDGALVLTQARAGGTAANGADIYLGMRNISIGNTVEDSPFNGEISHAMGTNAVLTDEDHWALDNDWNPPVYGTAYEYYPTASQISSTSAYATKGNVYFVDADLAIVSIVYRNSITLADADLVITEVVSGGGGGSDVTLGAVLAKVTGPTVSGTKTTVDLPHPLEVLAGQYIFVGFTRSGGSATDFAGVFFASTAAHPASSELTYSIAVRMADSDITGSEVATLANVFAEPWAVAPVVSSWTRPVEIPTGTQQVYTANRMVAIRIPSDQVQVYTANRMVAMRLPGAATFNSADAHVDITVSADGRTISKTTDGVNRSVRSTTSHATGKYYAEFNFASRVGSFPAAGFGTASSSLSSYTGSEASSIGVFSDGTRYAEGGATLTIASMVDGDVLCCAIDLDLGKVWFRKNADAWNSVVGGAQDPAANTGGITLNAGVTGEVFLMGTLRDDTDVMISQFGSSEYSQTAPSGFIQW